MKSIGFVVTFLTLVLDQVSKTIVVHHFANSALPIKIAEFFNIVLVYNKGISFGLFNQLDYSNYIFSCISIGIVCFLLKWLKDSAILWEKVGLALVIGGAIGNIIDRILYSAVVDFIQLHWHQYYWPSFNIADSAICLGVFILAVLNILKDRLKQRISNE